MLQTGSRINRKIVIVAGYRKLFAGLQNGRNSVQLFLAEWRKRHKEVIAVVFGDGEGVLLEM